MSAPVGRPKGPDTIPTGLRLPLDLNDQLEQAAIERDVSKNWLIVRALRDFLPRLVPVDEIEWTRKDET